jgi:hypothetical protein
MRRACLLFAILPLGCGTATEAVPGPDAGPDLLPGASAETDTCGPWAHFIVGQKRTWVGRFGQGQFETTTTVDSFEADGAITETVLSGDPDDFHGEGANHYQCDEEGLRTVDTSFEYLGPDGTLYFYQQIEYDPPTLRVRRALALGDTWEQVGTRYVYSSNGDAVQDVDLEYRVVAEQIAATAAGTWPTLLVEATDETTGDVAERDWRAEGVGAVIFATFTDGVPGFAQELTSIELPPPAAE